MALGVYESNYWSSRIYVIWGSQGYSSCTNTIYSEREYNQNPNNLDNTTTCAISANEWE